MSFRNRSDARRKLADALVRYCYASFLALPRGGVPVASSQGSMSLAVRPMMLCAWRRTMHFSRSVCSMADFRRVGIGMTAAPSVRAG